MDILRRSADQRSNLGRPENWHTVDAWSSDEEYAHLVNAVPDLDAKSGRWWAVVKIDNAHSVKVQLDTGADKSLLAYNLFRKMNVRSCPQPSSHQFQSYTGHPIRVKGSVILPTKYKSATLDVKYYIINTQQKPLLSGDDSRRLGLIDRINTGQGRG